MKKLVSYSLLAVLALMLLACGGPASRKAAETTFQPRKFPPAPSVPSMVTDPAEAAEYVISNFWNAFLDPSRTYPCDSNIVNGVKDIDVESAIGMYVTLLENSCSREFARKSVNSFFDRIEKLQAADTASNVFAYMEKTVTRYLYDPNSPVRDEDLYLPFVTRLAKSAFTDEGMKLAYSHDVEMCSLNRCGTPAADFSFTDLSGRKHSLYGIKADHVLLFFSNPGCPACREIVEQLCADGIVSGMIDSGSLAVVNIYIDEELDKWREYASTYPSSWYSGYDHTYSIRTDVSYNVRAIPSLYLLDSEKKVILKDAPTERVIGYLDNIR